MEDSLLDSSSESSENTELDSVQMELTTLSVSREASPTQMTGQHPPQMQMGALTTGKKHLDGVRAVQGGVSPLETGMDSSTHTTASHALSESDEEMAVSGGMVTPVELVSTVSQDKLVVNLQSRDSGVSLAQRRWSSLQTKSLSLL